MGSKFVQPSKVLRKLATGNQPTEQLLNLHENYKLDTYTILNPHSPIVPVQCLKYYSADPFNFLPHFHHDILIFYSNVLLFSLFPHVPSFFFLIFHSYFDSSSSVTISLRYEITLPSTSLPKYFLSSPRIQEVLYQL